MTKQLTPATHRAAVEKKIALGKDFDLQASLQVIRPEAVRAVTMIGNAADQATKVGAMLLELRDAMKLAAGAQWNSKAKPDALKFEDVLDSLAAELGYKGARQIRNWMGMAENSHQHLIDHAIDIDAIAVPFSQLLTLPAAELTDAAREAQQLLFSWMKENPTMRERLGNTALGGDDAHNITRARNGATKGGTRGEDRKAFDVFIARKLSDVGSHARHWDSFSAGQKDKTYTHIQNFLEKLPKPLVEAFLASAKEEMKKR